MQNSCETDIKKTYHPDETLSLTSSVDTLLNLSLQLSSTLSLHQLHQLNARGVGLGNDEECVKKLDVRSEDEDELSDHFTTTNPGTLPSNGISKFMNLRSSSESTSDVPTRRLRRNHSNPNEGQHVNNSYTDGILQENLRLKKDINRLNNEAAVYIKMIQDKDAEYIRLLERNQILQKKLREKSRRIKDMEDYLEYSDYDYIANTNATTTTSTNNNPIDDLPTRTSSLNTVSYHQRSTQNQSPLSISDTSRSTGSKRKVGTMRSNFKVRSISQQNSSVRKITKNPTESSSPDASSSSSTPTSSTKEIPSPEKRHSVSSLPRNLISRERAGLPNSAPIPALSPLSTSLSASTSTKDPSSSPYNPSTKQSHHNTNQSPQSNSSSSRSPSPQSSSSRTPSPTRTTTLSSSKGVMKSNSLPQRISQKKINSNSTYDVEESDHHVVQSDLHTLKNVDEDDGDGDADAEPVVVDEQDTKNTNIIGGGPKKIEDSLSKSLSTTSSDRNQLQQQRGLIFPSAPPPLALRNASPNPVDGRNNRVNEVKSFSASHNRRSLPPSSYSKSQLMIADELHNRPYDKNDYDANESISDEGNIESNNSTSTPIGKKSNERHKTHQRSPPSLTTTSPGGTVGLSAASSSSSSSSTNPPSTRRKLIPSKTPNKNYKQIVVNQLQSYLSPTAYIPYENIQLSHKLGRGISSVVYKALLRVNDDDGGVGDGKSVVCAVKILKLQDKEQDMMDFRKEIMVLSTIEGSNIIKFFGFCYEPKMCLIIEYCGNGSLYHYISDRKKNVSNNNNNNNNNKLTPPPSEPIITWERVLQWSLEVAKAINVLHTWKPIIVHRDLKTLNLLLDVNFSIKICDFGLSRFTPPVMEGDSDETLSKLRGTFAYTAPELYHKQQYTTKSDIYSIGIIMWELVTRLMKNKYIRPYGEYTDIVHDFQIIYAVAQKQKRPTIPENCRVKLKKLIEQCWDKDPAVRPTSSQLIDTIKDLRKDLLKRPNKWLKC
eukprot:TRINITY_DN1621_c1_g1_i1.p1 TRINITY_DN1621_c1_g1~~TRINITY_DN1621_c1_g1_i1.p1  ORF type:complete len:996 (+),score=277.91 TRINITY_DN1621_c1_g1_i1:238-3225(+)